MGKLGFHPGGPSVHPHLASVAFIFLGLISRPFVSAGGDRFVIAGTIQLSQQPEFPKGYAFVLLVDAGLSGLNTHLPQPAPDHEQAIDGINE